jgi:hypothetical protein
MQLEWYIIVPILVCPTDATFHTAACHLYGLVTLNRVTHSERIFRHQLDGGSEKEEIRQPHTAQEEACTFDKQSCSYDALSFGKGAL